MDPARRNGARTTRPLVRPRADVFETPEALVVVADVPGAEPDSIELLLVEDVLTLRARSSLRPPEDWQPAGAEFELPDYERTFLVAAEIDRDAPEAVFRNGRVKIVLRKRLPSTRRVDVRPG